MEKKSKNQPSIQGKSKGRVENLKPQKAGEPSHNPLGRPKGLRNRSTIVREWLEATYKKINPCPESKSSLNACTSPFSAFPMRDITRWS